MKLNIGVIFGSRTCEHDVSIISGLQAAGALDRASYEPTIIYISRDGRWFVGEALKDIAFYTAFDEGKVTQVIPAGEEGKLALYHLGGKKKLFGGGAQKLALLDVVMPVLHGLNGEDGTLQGMLELFNVPYTSAGVMGSAVGMDKITMKLLLKGAGFPVVEGLWFGRDRWSREPDAVIAELEALGYPLIVKPANLGSSIGIGLAKDRRGLEDAIDVACAYDHRILVERAIDPLREVNCSVVGYGDELETSELEMPVTAKDVLDFSEKYLRGGKGAAKGMQSLARQIPAPIPAAVADEIRRLSLAAFRAMDLKGVVRFDFMLDAQDRVYINEPNVIPGSLAFYLWEPKGVSFANLLDKMVESAFRAHADKNGSVFSYDSTILSSVLRGSKGAKGAKR